MYLPTTNTLAWATNSTGNMTLDASGNLGLGTTPFGWSIKAFDLGPTGGFSSVNNQLAYTHNAYYNGTNWIYKTTRFAGQYTQASGQHQWFTAPSGTAGNAISFTQAMTLDASGNLLVGTSSGSGSRLEVQGDPTNALIRVQSTAASDSANRAINVIKYANDSTTAQVFVTFAINQGATGSGRINANGASAAAFGSFSDRRLKENITALPNQLANILALKPSEFDFKDGSGHQIGFIAQEFEEVYPDCIGEGDDGMLTITGWSKTEARLVKAIQELTARLEALEGAK
jgi:hypothetical protein